MNWPIVERCSGTQRLSGRAARAGLWPFLLLALLAFAARTVAQSPNDHFTNATVIVGSVGSIGGANVGASSEPGEPIHYFSFRPHGGRSVWYRWTAPASGLVTFETSSSSFDPIMAAYVGPAVNVLQQLASDDDSGGGFLESLVTFQAVAGTEYHIAVDGYIYDIDPESGSFILNWNQGGGTNDPPVGTNEVQFASSGFTVTENTPGFVTIAVEYGGGAQGDVTVDYFTSDGTAIAGTDYVPVSGTLTFNVGQTVTTFTIPIQDNSLQHSNKTILLTLTNVTGGAVLGAISNSVVTIVDDETPVFVSTAGVFQFSSGIYTVTENETVASPFGLPNSSIGGSQRSARGAIITVTRTGGATGRVLVDVYVTNNFATNIIVIGTNAFFTNITRLTPDLTNTLVFDDYQMSASFIVPIAQQPFGFITNFFGSLNSQFNVVLANPRPDPAEDPAIIIPSLGPVSQTVVQVLIINSLAFGGAGGTGVGVFNIERATYRVDEYDRTIDVDVIFTGFTGGTIGFRIVGRPYRYAFFLQAGSDYTEADDDSPVLYPNTPYTDGTTNFLNEPDVVYQDVRLIFPACPAVGCQRQITTFTITNDFFPEFNEDIRLQLHDPIPGAPFGPNDEATITIVYDDQPAGAADREWDPELVSGTQPPFNTAPGANNIVSAVAVQPDNRTVIGGDFTAVNSVTTHYLARMNADGSLDVAFTDKLGTFPDGFVSSVVLYGTNSTNAGKILIAGGFRSVNGFARAGIARLNADGSLDTTFAPGRGANGVVHSVALQGNDLILVAGDFSTFNDLTVNGVMRLNPDGSLDGTFDPGVGADGPIWSIAVRDTAQTIFIPRDAAGTELEDVNVIDTGARQGVLTIDYDFLSVPDTVRVYYEGVRLVDLFTNGVGQLVVPFGPGASTDVTIIMNEGLGIPGTIWSYRAFVTPVVEDRTIYVGGEFTDFDGNLRIGVARLLENGSVDPTFDPGLGANGPIYAVAVQPNNRLIIGGAFDMFHTSTRNNIARLRRDGSLDVEYNVGRGANNSVYSIVLQPDNKALIGGIFQTYNGTRRMGLARLMTGGSLDTSFLDTGYNQFAGLPKTFNYDPPRYVNSIALQPDGNVMIGGSFTNLGGNFSSSRGLTLTPILQGAHVYSPFTRADKVTRWNVARLVGGYTYGPGNIEYDRNATPFTIDEHSGFFAVTMRRIDGRLGSAFVGSSISNNTALFPVDYGITMSTQSWPEFAFQAPRSVGFTGLEYLIVPITEDSLREGDETFQLLTEGTFGNIILGGEFIPLGTGVGFTDSGLATIADNDFDHGVFHFQISNFVTNENAFEATISVTRTNGSSGIVSVDYLLNDGTARGGQDYTNVVRGARTITFGEGETNRTFTVRILDNPEVEFDETVLLILTNATGGAVVAGGTSGSTATARATLTIVDNDFLAGRLNFENTGFTNSEGETFAAITVTRTGGSVGAMTVDYQTVDGSAEEPFDYSATSGTLSWAHGDSDAKTFLVPLVADGLVEGVETVQLLLLNPTLNGALGNRATATLYILDSDAFGTLTFNQFFYESDENGASPAITVVRRGGSGGTVSVEFSTVPLTATEGTGGDYRHTNGVLVFAPGEFSKTFRVPVLDDPVADGDKTLQLVLANPSNATLGPITNAVLNLVDNESISIPAGALDTTFSARAAANAAVYALLLQPDGRLIMAGDFTQVANVPRSRIARLKPNGSLDNSFDIGPGANDSIRALALQSDGKLVIGGLFTVINSTNRSGISRLTPDGANDVSFNIGSGTDNPVFALAIQPDDKIIVGGSFSTFNGATAPGVLRLNTNGTIDLAFQVGAGINGTVFALGLQSDGKVLVGGEFISFNGVSRTNLIRLHPNGTLDLTFDAGGAMGTSLPYPDAPVRAILVEADGRIVIGGSFTHINGVERNYLARLNADGALDAAFLGSAGGSPALSGADNTVYAIAQQVDGKLIVGGDFKVFNNVTRNGITRLNDLDGSTDPTINFGNGANGFVAALALQPDRKIVLGGGFTEYDDEARGYIARIHGGSIAGSGSLEFSRPEFLVRETETNATITVRRLGGTTGTVAADYSMLDGTALAGRDYIRTSGTLMFPQGETRQVFTVTIFTNDVPDGDRTLYVQLSNFDGAVAGPQPIASLTILDDESIITFTAGDYSVNENTVSGNATIGVARTGGTNNLQTVQVFTTDITAVAGADYIATNGTVTFRPGETFKNFNVRILEDALIEANETLRVSLANASGNATLGISNAVLAIVNNDFGPGQFLLSTNSIIVDEFGGAAVVTVIRTNGSEGIVSVQLTTSDGTAFTGSDYIGTNRVITFAQGETVKSLPIVIFNDNIREPEEFFNVTLSNPSPGTSILAGSAIVSIIDDEFAPSFVGFQTNDFRVMEDVGTALVTVVRTNGRRGTVSVDYVVTAGSATAGLDFVLTGGTITFLDNEFSKTFPVQILNDTLGEPDETIRLSLSNLQTNGTTATFSLPTATLTIVDDDTTVHFASPSYTTSEDASNAVITVIRGGRSSTAITVAFTTRPGGTGIGGIDYIPVSGTLSWAAGDGTPKTFLVPIIDNAVVNAGKTVLLALTNITGVGAYIDFPSNAVLTITDNEAVQPVAGVVDPTFNGLYGANATVRAVAFDAQERLHVGGAFTRLYGYDINRIARLAANGAVDPTFDPGTGANDVVHVISRATNGIYIGGAFTMVNNISRPRLARLRTDGSVDPAFLVGTGPSALVRALAALANNQVYVGGDFTSINGAGANRLARLHPSGAIDTAFNIGAGPNGIVRAVAVQTNGQVVIGGDFTAVNGFLLTRLARLNADGVVDTSFNTSVGADGPIRSIAIQLDGRIIVAGDFQTLNGVPRNRIARLNPDGGMDFSFNPGDGANGPIHGITIQTDGHIVAVGEFTELNGNAFNYIGRFNIDGSVDTGFDIGTGANAPAYAVDLANVTSTLVIPRSASGTELEDRFTVDTGANSGLITIDYDFLFVLDNIRVYYAGVRIFDLTTNGTGRLVIPYGPGPSTLVTVVMNEGIGVLGTVWFYTLTINTGARLDNRIAVGGDFTEINNTPRGRVAVLNSTGSLYPLFDPAGIPAHSVYGFGIYTNAAQPDLVGKLVVGGDFTAIVGVNGQNRIARLNIDGSFDRAFMIGAGFNDTVRAVALQPDGKVIAGGLFTSYDTLPRTYLARLNPDGTLDNTFNAVNNGANINNVVNAIELQPDGKVIIGGNFSLVYGVNRFGIARLNQNGTIDSTFNVGIGANAQVRAVALQPDGKVLVGGDFTAVNGVPANRVARLNSNGTVDTTFNAGAGPNGPVYTLALAADGDVLIGGSFTSVAGAPRNSIARLNSDGSFDAAFNPGTGGNEFVSSIAVQQDGKLVVGGAFTTFNGQLRNRLVRLNSDGSLDATINFGTGANNFVNAVELQEYDGKIVIGGGFTRFDEEPRVGIARLFAGTNVGSGTFQFSAPAYTVNENVTNLVVTVLRTGGTLGDVTVSFTTVNGTAIAGQHYAATGGTLTFASGESFKQINIPIVDDVAINAARTFSITLFNPTGGAGLGSPSTAQVTIQDNDSVISFSTPDYFVNENGIGARITVLRTGGTLDTVSVTFATGTNGSATPNVDFIPRNFALVFAPGVSVQTVEVPVLDDTLREFDETVPLSLANVVGPAVLGLSSAQLTIIEDDLGGGEIGFATNSFSVVEDDGFATVTVVRTNGHTGNINVRFFTADGSARDGADYRGTNYSLTLLDGQTSVTVRIPIVDDMLVEGTETVLLQLTEATGDATLGLSSAVLNILDNDLPGSLVFDRPVFMTNENSGSATITVRRINGNVGNVGVTVETSDGTARAGLDYTAVLRTLSFQPSQTVQTFAVPLTDDALNEGTETVNLLLSNPTGGATIGAQGTAVLWILDNEISVGLSALNTFASESSTNAVVNVVRLGETNIGFRVSLATSDGSANSNGDYVAANVTLDFAPGETNKAVSLVIRDDTLAEGDEFFNVTLSNPTAGVSLGPILSASITIVDNDTAFNFSAATYPVIESGGSVTITVTRSGSLVATNTVQAVVQDGTASGGFGFGFDYLRFFTPVTLVFPPGVSNQSFTITIFDDVTVEGNETIRLSLQGESAGTFLGAQQTAVVNIIEDDTVLAFSEAVYVVNEKGTNAVITITRSGATAVPVSVNFSTGGGSASAGLDYLAVNTTVSWVANDTSPKTVIVPVLDDAIAEGAETVNLLLANATGGATIDPVNGTAVLRIVDNAGVISFASASYNVIEGSGNAVLALVRTGGTNGVVSVNWNVTGGSATSGQDYAGASGAVVFADGETTKPILISITEDGAVEGVETVNIRLTSAGGGARVGSPDAAVLNITDNDAGIIVGAGSALLAESFAPTNQIIEAGETVTLLLALRNAGIVNADNVTATLVNSNGISFAGTQAQNYGALIPGGNSVSRPFTFTAVGSNGTRLTATLLITNNGLFLGEVAFSYTVGRAVIPFANANAITIDDNAPATPFPATLTVSGVAGPVTRLTVTLHNVSHLYPDDLDIILVGPNGANVMLMSDAGGGNPNALNNVTITFDDAAAFNVPDTARITNGSYKPFNYGPDAVVPPAPGPPYGSALSVFDGIDPNGVWSLYVIDDNSQDEGVIAGGWSLSIATSDAVISGADVSVAVIDSPDPVTQGGTITYTVSVTNHGPSMASAVTVTNILPAGSGFANGTAPAGVSVSGDRVTAFFGSLAMGAGANATIVVTAPGTPGAITFDATVSAGETDLNPGNNHVAVKTTVSDPSAVPLLFGARKSSQLVLSWQTAPNVVLQAAPSFVAPAWGPVANPVVESNGVSTVTVPLSAAPSGFYRLRRVP